MTLLHQVPSEVTVHRCWTLDLPFWLRKSVKKTVTVGSESFSYVVDTTKVLITLNATGLKLLKHDHGKLSVTATASYDPGTGKDTASAHATLSLHGKV